MDFYLILSKRICSRSSRPNGYSMKHPWLPIFVIVGALHFHCERIGGREKVRRKSGSMQWNLFSPILEEERWVSGQVVSNRYYVLNSWRIFMFLERRKFLENWKWWQLHTTWHFFHLSSSKVERSRFHLHVIISHL